MSLSPQQSLDLAKKLLQERGYGYARRILALARKHPDANDEKSLQLKLAQWHALCTYKDPDLAYDSRLDSALEILDTADDLKTTNNQETLGITGAIYKSRYEADGQKQHLEVSLAYYMKGYRIGIEPDFGYTAINAAYILDLLASLEGTSAGDDSEIAQSRRSMAKQIRHEIIEVLQAILKRPEHQSLENEYWFLVTMAEAYFGLGCFQEAIPLLKKAADIEGLPPWQRETTARQLASLAMISEGYSSTAEIESSEAWQALSAFLKSNVAGVRTAFLGKVGLALSGGGFRASLFHIGVLAKLAELDMLRHVEVLSCVSGGSIIGAHYYLEVRKLLQEKHDNEIKKEDYIEIVKRIEEDFVKGVQKNIRTRVALNPLKNLRMIFKPAYSRTVRVGELYETEIFARVKDGGGDKPRWLNDLFVNPMGEGSDFRPKYDNWRRNAKVPILILNATPLNTGHNWQFTASWMGEPPPNRSNEVDGNYRFRRMYYSDAPKDAQRVRLGHAVAASSCVPGLFEPITLTSLYQKKVVRLVDGGVHDNQGVAALLDQHCSVLLVSDASGQMHTIDAPGTGMLGVPLRSNSILMSRVREAQYLDLVARRRSSLLRGVMFIHLKKGLQSRPVDWIDCEDPYDGSDGEEFYDPAGDPEGLQLTRYGILKKVQMRLSAIRTDLDSFSDVEAFALMTSGYHMTEHEFSKCIEGFPLAQGSQPWRFLSVEKRMKQVSGCKDEHEDMIHLLEAAKSTGFKIWKISKALRYVSLLIGVVALVVFAKLMVDLWQEPLPSITVGRLLMPVLFIVGLALAGKLIAKVSRVHKSLDEICLGIVLVVIGWIVSGIHILVFDRWFLSRGRVAVVKDKAEKARAAGR
jgi:predicted acylesterase/phospholipase RssA